MRHFKCYSLLLLLTALGGLASPGPIALGASIGAGALHKHQQHQQHAHQALAGVPSLHETAPLHVPVLSNAALVKLALHNQFSPILRDPGIEKQLATALTAARNANPTRFDRQNPLLGHLIRDPNYLQTVLAAYNSNPARFTRFHHYLIPFLRGAAMLTPTPTTPPPSGTGSEQTTPPGSTIVS